MRSESDLASLIAAIYETGMDFSLWPDALRRIAAAFDAPSAGMARQGETPADCWIFSSGMEPEYEKKYMDYYHSVNPVWQSVPTAPVGTVQTDTMVIPRRELSRTEFFNDFLVPQRMGGLLNAVVLMEEGRQTVVTVQGNREFEASHVELHKILTPHLQRAVQINIKLARAELHRIAAVETLNQLEEGVLFVDLNARIMFANRAAERFFANRDLRLNKGRLHAGSAAETATLHAVIAKCAETGIQHRRSNFVSLRREAGRSPLSLLIAPLPMETSSGLVARQPMAVIFVNDPDQKSKPTAVQLREKFGMTPAEAGFAVEILKGDGIQAAADRLSISRATARTHLSRIFDKTGTRRQAELVRVLLSTGNSIL
jgi:DNA-binding CsgD family transcriptional regulator/PAS domain-containing protein